MKNPLRRHGESPSEPKSPISGAVKRTRRISRAVSQAPNRLSKFLFSRGPAPDPELEGLENQVQELRATDEDLKERLRTVEEELEETRQRLKNRDDRREDLKRITKELAVAQRFLSTADSLSQAEVVRAMDDLNEEIFQLTSIVADTVQVQEKKFQTKERQTFFREKISALGPAFLEVVVPKQLEDSLAIQIGWQAILADWCCEVIEAWVVREVGSRDSKLNKAIDDIYRGIMSQNDQAVGGRWRSIFYQVTEEVSSETRAQLLVPVVHALTALPVLCGYVFSQKRHEELGNAFHQRIGPLLDKSLRFRKMVGGGITSTDIRPYLFKSGDQYDPSYVDLEYEDEKNGSSNDKQGIVACSLGVGLYCTRSAKGPDGGFAESREPILKPKVILQETLKEIIE